MVVNIVALVLLIAVQIYTQCKLSDSKRIKLIRCCLFVVYVYILLSFTLLNRDTFDTSMYNLKPFSSYIALMKVPWFGWGEYILRATIGNVLLFVPLGLLFGSILRSEHVFLNISIIAFLFSVTIEITQILLLVGTFEVDDLINNILGALIGCSIVQVVSQKEFNFVYLTRVLWLIVYFVIIAAVSLLAIMKDM